MATLPASIEKVRALDAMLAAEIADAFARLTRAADGMVWAQSRLSELLRAESATAVLQIVTRAANEISSAPHIWALLWRNSDGKNASVRTFVTAAKNTGAAARDVPRLTR